MLVHSNTKANLKISLPTKLFIIVNTLIILSATAILFKLLVIQQYVALLAIFCNPAIRQLHWDKMSAIAGFDLTPDAGTTLRKIINMNLIEDLEK